MNTFRFISPLLIILLSLPYSACRLVRPVESSFACPPSSNASVIPEGFGVNIHFTDPNPGELNMLSGAGFRWVRMDFKWDATEKERGRYDFSAYDRLMTELDAHGVRALFILDYGNPLYDNGAPPRNETTRTAFVHWAVAAAKHFAGRGILWEVYNEPNHSLFWPPKPDVQEYIALAMTVGRAFRASVPQEKLIGPATAEIDFDFVEACLKAGLLEYWSAVSIHPYRRSDPETAAADYCRLRELIRLHTPARKKELPIISSEWGYSAAWPRENAERQGELLARTWLTNLANGVSLSIWYDWRDDGSDANEPEHHFGLVANRYYEGRESVYDQKPAYLAARTLSTFFKGYRFERRLPVGAADDHVLVFRKGNELRFAVWTTANASKGVKIPVSSGRYATTGHTGRDAGMVNAESGGLKMNLTGAPVFLRLVS